MSKTFSMRVRFDEVIMCEGQINISGHLMTKAAGLIKFDYGPQLAPEPEFVHICLRDKQHTLSHLQSAWSHI